MSLGRPREVRRKSAIGAPRGRGVTLYSAKHGEGRRRFTRSPDWGRVLTGARDLPRTDYQSYRSGQESERSENAGVGLGVVLGQE